MKSKNHYLRELSLSLICFTAIGCASTSSFVENANPVGNTTSDTSLTDPTDMLTADYIPNIYAGKAALGVKNYEQIFESMRVVMGLGSMSLGTAPLSTINTTFLGLKAALPANNVMASFSPSNMLFTSILATSFCQNTLGNAATRQALFGGSNILTNAGAIITATPATFFSIEANRISLAQFLASKFWGANEDADADRITAENKISTLLNDLSTAATPTPTMTNVIIGACVAALSSPNLVLF